MHVTRMGEAAAAYRQRKAAEAEAAFQWRGARQKRALQLFADLEPEPRFPPPSEHVRPRS